MEQQGQVLNAITYSALLSACELRRVWLGTVCDHLAGDLCVGQADRRTDGRSDGRTDGRTIGRKDGRTVGRSAR